MHVLPWLYTDFTRLNGRNECGKQLRRSCKSRKRAEWRHSSKNRRPCPNLEKKLKRKDGLRSTRKKCQHVPINRASEHLHKTWTMRHGGRHSPLVVDFQSKISFAYAVDVVILSRCWRQGCKLGLRLYHDVSTTCALGSLLMTWCTDFRKISLIEARLYLPIKMVIVTLGEKCETECLSSTKHARAGCNICIIPHS